jgi:saxitoxin biosynthesis operon SxtJ-like protein
MLTIIAKALWTRWKAIAHVIGWVQSQVLLSVFYFVVLGPLALAMRLLGDPLRLRSGTPTHWLERPVTDDIAAAARRQGLP